ncbi:hypothetical protein [Phaeobacter gallaeciensis]|uniref:hypothetical protein n=1 Tax=Phaeobacter gallaeciensis TaxID=60890 RepID=UPI00237F467A|nr:hypothetical protein [Phaeobacter gallaeciensis]MDE4096665.1 hypothetical protein [Phaeobacter gallaeciensis]MDE4105476.1 hypothetical protein [Phaeobacter gallaeciensis]MDE4109932.1 hypothetical protein [Phaeobacter gallaeciensis]MDE4114400.1 hypothetical protein [Phaeobacter gallaeciensis]MDE4118867.1 hypothetical protein [Phaeobacter gallaeciensis]
MNDAALPGLVVEVEARVDRLEKGLARANRAQRRAAQNMERRAKKSADRIGATYAKMGSGIAASFKGMAVPLVGGIASASTLRAIADTTKGIAQLGDEAKRAGVSAQAFQEWKFVAEQNRIGIDAMVDGLKELNNRADEFIITGKGPAAEAFARLGYGADELGEKLKDPSELLLEMMGRMRRLNVAARIRVASELFGDTAGERFVELVEQGEDGLRRTVGRAHELGLVLGDDVVAKADEVTRKFDELTARMSNFGKRVAVAIAEGITEIADFRARLDQLFEDEAQGRAVLGDGVYDALKANRDALDDHKRELREIKDAYAEVFALINRMTGPDGIRVFEIDDEDARFALADIMGEMKSLVDQFSAGQITADEFSNRLTEVVEDAQDVTSELAEIDGAKFANVINAIGGIADAIKVAFGEAQKLKNVLPGAYTSSGRGDGASEVAQRNFEGNQAPSDLAPTSSLRPKPAPALIDEPGTRRSGGGSADEFERTAQAISEETRLLQLEAAALIATAAAGGEYASSIEMARREAELLHAAQQQGREITPALRAEIRQLAQDYATAADAAAQAENGLDRLQSAKDELRGTLSGAFTDLVTGARDFDSVLQSVLGRLAEMAASRAFENILTGMGGLGGGTGFFGTLLSLLGFASGGYTGDGGKFEPAGVVHKGEYVLSKEATRRIGVGNLEALHSAAKRGYASGGLVGGAASLRGAQAARSGPVADSGQAITINAPVTVHGSAGSPEQNADLARRMSREMEAVMRGTVADEMRRQMRPGNMLNNRRR